MGKGYNNYMCKKPFHPGSKGNIKRTWMAEQKTENDKKKQDELRVQYEKEQDSYNNRALISTESKDKLALNFMYEAPPGVKKDRLKEDDEPEYKFEWQRKYNAPREDYARGNSEIRDQPFGIQVRNVRCIKCHKWGHINTDKECPLYNRGSAAALAGPSMDPSELMRRMKEEEGLQLKAGILGLPGTIGGQMAGPPRDEEEEDTEMQFLRSLSTKEKKKLLKKLEKCDKKKGKKKRKRKRDTSSDSSDDEPKRKKHKKIKKRKQKKRKESKKKKKKHHHHHHKRKARRSSTSSSSSSSSSDSDSSSSSSSE